MPVRASRQPDDVTSAERRFDRQQTTSNDDDGVAERDEEGEGQAEEDRTVGRRLKVFENVVSIEDCHQVVIVFFGFLSLYLSHSDSSLFIGLSVSVRLFVFVCLYLYLCLL